MGSSIFLLLFLLGVMLALLGGVIGVIDAFQVNPGWGLLTLLIPFALLVFCIKFWERRRWARNSLILGLLGLASMVIGMPFLQGLLSRRVASGAGSGESLSVEVPILEDKGEAEIFTEALVPAAPGFAAIARANLIQSTDADERRRLVNSSRPDPFATVPIPPPPLVTLSPSTTVTPGAGNGTAGLPLPVSPPSPPRGQSPVTPPQPSPPGATPPVPGGAVNGAGLPPSPPLQADQVEVTGVIALGGHSYAIVRSPEQPGGQYLKVGQRFGAGNQILVKRIDMKGQEPIVVLEEKGREVQRFVGPASEV